jgi:alpha-maltose-1-phosphate synthase
MKVLLLASEYGPQVKGGLGTHIMALAQGMARAGLRVTVLVYTMERARTIVDGSLTVYFVPVSASRFNTRHGSMRDEVLAVNEALTGHAQTLFSNAGERPDLVHCHDWYFFPTAQDLGRELGVPVIATAHMLQDPMVRFWGGQPDPEVSRREQSMCRGADAVIAVSHSMRELIQNTHGTPGERLHVVHNGFDAAPFLASAWKPAQVAALRQSVASPGEQIVLFASRLDPQKGIAAFYQSAARVVTAMPNIRYLIAGGADTRHDGQMMQQLAADHRALERRVKLLGPVERKQLALLYQIADLAIVPSLYESFGYAAVEAMAAGVPVVATHVGGLAEIIEHNRTGLLVPVHVDAGGLRHVDVDQLVEAQLTVLGNPELARQLGQAGRERAVQTFNVDRMVAATMQVYRQCLERR